MINHHYPMNPMGISQLLTQLPHFETPQVWKVHRCQPLRRPKSPAPAVEGKVMTTGEPIKQLV